MTDRRLRNTGLNDAPEARGPAPVAFGVVVLIWAVAMIQKIVK
jgi:hypothetical protein